MRKNYQTTKKRKLSTVSEPPKFTASTKIGVLRMSTWSELMMSLPMLLTLRKMAPKSEIVYIGSDWHARFIKDHIPYVDRVIEMSGEATEKVTWSDRRLTQDCAPLIKEKFDVLFQAHDYGWLGDRMVNIIKPKYSVGFSNDPKSPLSRAFRVSHGQNEVTRLLELLTPWNTADFHLRSEIVVLPEDFESTKQQMDGIMDENYVVIHPGATDVRRRWPLRRFAKLAEWLNERGYPVVITGSLAEKDLAIALQSATKAQLINQAGLMTMGSTLAILQHASLVISNDSAPLHIARALDTPSVGLYAARYFTKNGPIFANRTQSIVSAMTECPSCNGDIFNTKWPALDEWLQTLESPGCRHDESSLISDISVARVIDAAELLLDV